MRPTLGFEKMMRTRIVGRSPTLVVAAAVLVAGISGCHECEEGDAKCEGSVGKYCQDFGGEDGSDIRWYTVDCAPKACEIDSERPEPQCTYVPLLETELAGKKFACADNNIAFAADSIMIRDIRGVSLVANPDSFKCREHQINWKMTVDGTVFTGEVHMALGLHFGEDGWRANQLDLTAQMDDENDDFQADYNKASLIGESGKWLEGDFVFDPYTVVENGYLEIEGLKMQAGEHWFGIASRQPHKAGIALARALPAGP